MNKTVVVIEDEEDIRSTLTEFLELEGYNVLSAENGFEAMKQLKDSCTPDLILLDMKMPVMNGWEFAAEFHKLYNHSSPIVVITAAADAEQRAIDIDAEGWIAKPFDLETLLEKVKEFERPVSPT